MIDVDEAHTIVLEHVRPGPTIDVALGNALYATLAEPILCDVDYPPFDRSLMDGYAVRSRDVAAADRAPVTLEIAGQIAAGSEAIRPLETGEAMQINTGAPIPSGADAVVRVEETELAASGKSVVIRAAVGPGKFVTPRGEYVSAGRTVLTAGTIMTPLEIGVAATCGASMVSVFRRPRVAVLVTGDELVDADTTPVGPQIRDSNRYILESLIKTAHASPEVLPRAGDDRDTLRRSIERGARCEALCITGGVSMGAFDFVPEVLAECGATIHIRKLAIKPGRPVIFATMPGGAAVFALPGNPLSAFVAFELLVRPALAMMQGRPTAPRSGVRARLSGRVAPTRDRRAFIPARVTIDKDGGLIAEPLSWRGSGDPFGAATANALIVQPPGAHGASNGEHVLVMLLDRV